MSNDSFNETVVFDKQKLKQIREQLSHTLHMLDFYDVTGVIAICLLPAGDSFYAASGRCQDPRGAAAGLYAAITTIHELAEKQADTELAETLATVAAALEPLAVPGRQHHVH